MPGVSSFTPAWLSRPSPGFSLFNHNPFDTSKKQPGGTESTATGPNRTIASRGTELFVAVGNEIRWSDLILLRHQWEEHKHGGAGAKDEEVAYRVRTHYFGYDMCL